MDENRIADGDFSCSNRRINIITLIIGFLIFKDCERATVTHSMVMIAPQKFAYGCV